MIWASRAKLLKKLRIGLARATGAKGQQDYQKWWKSAATTQGNGQWAPKQGQRQPTITTGLPNGKAWAWAWGTGRTGRVLKTGRRNGADPDAEAVGKPKTVIPCSFAHPSWPNKQTMVGGQGAKKRQDHLTSLSQHPRARKRRVESPSSPDCKPGVKKVPGKSWNDLGVPLFLFSKWKPKGKPLFWRAPLQKDTPISLNSGVCEKSTLV